jgi:hypothetical protein
MCYFLFAILSNEITQAWADKSVKEYKKFKGLKKQNLRDNMSNLELVLNMLAEASVRVFFFFDFGIYAISIKNISNLPQLLHLPPFRQTKLTLFK